MARTSHTREVDAQRQLHAAQRSMPLESLVGMAQIPAGHHRIGSDGAEVIPGDGEGPARSVRLEAFRIDITTVTNAQFAQFVQATGHRSDAQLAGWSFVFYAAVHPRAAGAVRRDAAVAMTPWWLAVDGADWRHPFGPGSDLGGLEDHPVVHVSWNDAQAFAAWAGKRLPTEAEWEVAARAGSPHAYPWGDELTPGTQHRCNIWQGHFPHDNTAQDGYLGTAPARSFEPNAFGLYNVVGNVWEWTADDWRPDWHAPTGTLPRPHEPMKSIRGGSYLCHASWCSRYRLSARSFNSPHSSTGHMGLRCATSAPGPIPASH